MSITVYRYSDVALGVSSIENFDLGQGLYCNRQEFFDGVFTDVRTLVQCVNYKEFPRHRDQCWILRARKVFIETSKLICKWRRRMSLLYSIIRFWRETKGCLCMPLKIGGSQGSLAIQVAISFESLTRSTAWFRMSCTLQHSGLEGFDSESTAWLVVHCNIQGWKVLTLRWINPRAIWYWYQGTHFNLIVWVKDWHSWVA
jgi:hypothetical protein